MEKYQELVPFLEEQVKEMKGYEKLFPEGNILRNLKTRINRVEEVILIMKKDLQEMTREDIIILQENTKFLNEEDPLLKL